jgi:hypothetical protein
VKPSQLEVCIPTVESISAETLPSILFSETVRSKIMPRATVEKQNYIEMSSEDRKFSN